MFKKFGAGYRDISKFQETRAILTLLRAHIFRQIFNIILVEKVVHHNLSRTSQMMLTILRKVSKWESTT